MKLDVPITRYTAMKSRLTEEGREKVLRDSGGEEAKFSL